MSIPNPDRPIRLGPYPELTWPAVWVGWLLGSVIAISIGYAALILGFSIEGSELAAILGWGILRGAMRRSSIIENNINQTIASAVNGASAGMMFSIPALFILASPANDPSGQFASLTQFSIPLMVLACITGGYLGLAFVIPLRRQMIDFDRLAYPGGIAVAAILKSPGAGIRKAQLLLGGAIVSAIFSILIITVNDGEEYLSFCEPVETASEEEATEDADEAKSDGSDALPATETDADTETETNAEPDVVAESDVVAELEAKEAVLLASTPKRKTFWRPPAYLNITIYLSLMTIGVGFLSGRGGFWFGAGGFICYWFLAPLIAAYGSGTETMIQDPDALRMGLFRPTGIGMLIGAAIGGIVAAFPLIRSALKSMHQSRHQASDGSTKTRSDEMPVIVLYAGVIVGLILLIAICYNSVNDPQMSLWRAALMAVLGTVWVWVAGVIVSECLGRTNWSPLSGMTLIAVTILLVIAQAGTGMQAAAAVLSSVILGAAICVAIAQAGDMMLDLKSGYLVGAMPRRQQLAQFIGVWLGPILIIGLIFILHEQYGLGSDKLPAPQGEALASMIEGVVSEDVPLHRYVAGAGLGASLSFSGLGGIGVLIGLGFYMPFAIVLTYTIGNVLRIASDRFNGKQWSQNVGIPVAAGLIVGEALVGVGNAFWSIVGGKIIYFFQLFCQYFQELYLL